MAVYELGGHENDGPKMTEEREIAGEKMLTATTLQLSVQCFVAVIF